MRRLLRFASAVILMAVLTGMADAQSLRSESSWLVNQALISSFDLSSGGFPVDGMYVQQAGREADDNARDIDSSAREIREKVGR